MNRVIFISKLIYTWRQLFYWFKEVLMLNLWVEYQIREKEAIVALRAKLCRAKVVQIRPNRRSIVLVTSSFWLFMTSQPCLYCKGMFPASTVPRASQPRCSTQDLGAEKAEMQNVSCISAYIWASPVPCVALCFYLCIRTHIQWYK